MLGIELDMVVSDSLEALKTYEDVFGAVRVEATSYETGLNEAVFMLNGLRIHLLDENPDYNLIAPQPGDNQPSWLNLIVSDIHELFSRAKTHGFTTVQAPIDMPEMGIANAVVVDPYGYAWMLHEVHEELSFEERTEVLDKQFRKDGEEA